jgi:hypothetical protein
VQLSVSALEDYLAQIAQLLERFGVVLDLEPTESLVLDVSASGTMSFRLRGFLPDGRKPPLSVLEIRERWRPVAADVLERWEYEFELVDHERGFRRAFHLHDSDYFVRHFHVVVHDHCENPIGFARRAHMAGNPVLDGYRGVSLLIEAWMDPSPPECDEMPCLTDRMQT